MASPLGFSQAATTPAASTTTAAAAPAASDTIVLTPFEVSTDKDRGYFGGSTLAGGRADTPLKITPASISVMTKEFLQDFDLTDMNQALQWTVGADAPQGGEAGAFGSNRFQTSFRGVDGNGNFPVRDGSISYYVADSYNTERLDFSRGPNAALFGDGGPGGLQGSTSKQARLNNKSGEVSARFDNWGSYRGTADYNYGVDRLAVRTNILYSDTKSYQKGTSDKHAGLTVALTYKISDATQFRASMQRDSEKNIAYQRTFSENASRWNRTFVNTDNSAVPSATQTSYGVGQVTTTNTTVAGVAVPNDYIVYNFGTNSLLNYKGNQFQTLGLGFAIPWDGRPELPNFKPGVAKDFRLGSADATIDRDFNAQTYYLDHRFSQDLFVQLGIVKNDGDPYYNNTNSIPRDYRIDINRLLPNGVPNPNFGKAYSDFVQQFEYQQDKVREYKGNATYKFTAPNLWDWSQRFSFNGGWRRTTFEGLTSRYVWTNNPNIPNLDSAANQLRYRVYWDNPNPSLNGVVPPNTPGMDWRLYENGGNINQRTITYGQLVSQSTFFEERLAITGNFRRDKVEGHFTSRLGADPVTLKNIQGFDFGAGAGGAVVGARKHRKVYMNSPGVGIVTYPFAKMQNKWIAPLGFVANQSTNFTQIGASSVPLLNGDDPPLTNSKTKDIGLRYALGDGDAYITLTKYNTTQENQLSGWGTRGNLQNLYSALGYSEPEFTGSTGFNYQDVASRKLEGWEAEVTANVRGNISLQASYSHPLVYTVFESRDRRAFYEANRAYYAQAASVAAGTVVNGRTVTDPTMVRDSMTAIENSLNGTTPGTLSNGVGGLDRHRINVAAIYRFTEGPLRGLGVNAGVNYRGHRKIGSRDPNIKFNTANPTVQQTAEAAYDYLWAAPTWMTTAGANYTKRFGKTTARFQINIANLFNESSPTWTSYSVIPAGQLTNNAPTGPLAGSPTTPGGNDRMQVLSGYNQPTPRTISFTTTFSF